MDYTWNLSNQSVLRIEIEDHAQIQSSSLHQIAATLETTKEMRQLSIEHFGDYAQIQGSSLHQLAALLETTKLTRQLTIAHIQHKS